jgi:tripartite-type tricarboxylate transporter receptor subunit TctC
MWAIGRSNLALIALVGLVVATGAASAQDLGSFPTKPVRVIIPFAAGGGNDILARIVGAKLGELLGQQIINENRPGAGGRLAAQYVLGQPKDGYTIYLGATGGTSVAAAAYPNLSYHPTRSFIPLSMIANYPLVLVTNPNLPIENVRSLIAFAKKYPERANYPATSPAFIIASELLKLKSGMPGQMIPYRSSNEMVLSVIQSQTLFALSDPSPATPQIRAGQIRALAVTDQVRMEGLPDVPTIAEEGYPEVDIKLFSGYFIAAGTPEPLVKKLELALIKAIRDPGVVARLKDLAVTPKGTSSNEFAAIINRDIDSMSKVISAAHLKFEDQ